MKPKNVVFNFCCLLLIMFSVFISGCHETKGETESKSIIIDGEGRQVELILPIKSAAIANSHNVEFVNSIGNAINKVVGVDSNAHYNEKAYNKRFSKENVIGANQKQLNFEKIIKLNPDVLILSNNGQWREAEKVLEPFGIKVFVFNAYYTCDFEKNCKIIGQLFGEEKAAADFYNYFNDKLEYVHKQLKNVPKRRVYFEYRRENVTVTPGRPYYTMLTNSGGENIFDDVDSPYIDGEEIILRNPQYIVKVSDNNVRGSYDHPTVDEFKIRKQNMIERPGWEEIDAVKNDNMLFLSHYAFDGASEIVGALYIAKFLYPEYLPDLHPEKVFSTWLTQYQRIPYISGHTYPAFGMDD